MSPWLMGVIGFAAGLIVALAGSIVFFGGRSTRPGVTQPAPPVPAAGAAEPRWQRDELMRAYDLGTAEQRRVVAGKLLGLGVGRLDAAGPIDPHHHHVVQVVTVTDLPEGEWVGEVLRPGWVDADGVLRPAEVIAHVKGDDYSA